LNPETVVETTKSAMGLYGPDGQVKLVRDVFRDLEWLLRDR
jgi:hypothetical protein